MFFKKSYHKNLLLIFIFFILYNCQLQEPTKNHGILFLKNRADKLAVNKSNKNDVIQTIGQPHSKSISDEDNWIYIERVLTKGEFHKLGQNVLKTNNILILTFDKYGVLKKKDFLDKNSKKKISFSENQTINDISQKSFVEKFLQSLKSKMYKKQ
jgi:outer membrane protein assembly factor BamE (lipoprotein component of BamABCDE complex)|tara:strand:+ start:611 stop:1075 length:465 start_codon:yes stop_codon:yes gene_type:complete